MASLIIMVLPVHYCHIVTAKYAVMAKTIQALLTRAAALATINITSLSPDTLKHAGTTHARASIAASQ